MTTDNWINIGAVIFGLFGVFITLLYNARLAREQQHRQWKHDLERAGTRDAHERAVLRSALTTELQQIRESIQLDVEAVRESRQKGEECDMLGFSEPHMEIYEAILPRIGILSVPEVDAIAEAYKGLKTQTQKVNLLGSHGDIGQIRIPHNNTSLYMIMMEVTLKEIDAALETLAYHQH